jgi:hypothetical protein
MMFQSAERSTGFGASLGAALKEFRSFARTYGAMKDDYL